MQWLVGETEMRQQLPVDYPGRINRDMTDWIEQIDRLTEGLCKHLIVHHSSALGLPADAGTWPNPRGLPSLWLFSGSYLAYECVSLQRGRKLDPNDDVDLNHVVAAAHSDVFVTNDTALQKIVELCPTPKPRLMDFNGWLGQVADKNLASFALDSL